MCALRAPRLCVQPCELKGDSKVVDSQPTQDELYDHVIGHLDRLDSACHAGRGTGAAGGGDVVCFFT